MAHLTMGCYRIKHESKADKFKEVDRLHPCPVQTVQDIIIPGNGLHDPTFIRPSCPDLRVVVSASAGVATELLV